MCEREGGREIDVICIEIKVNACSEMTVASAELNLNNKTNEFRLKFGNSQRAYNVHGFSVCHYEQAIYGNAE